MDESAKDGDRGEAVEGARDGVAKLIRLGTLFA